MRGRLTLAVVGLAAALAASGQASPDKAACPPPKPLPASVKKPQKGASATQLANFLLALPQRKPCDVNLFTSTFANGAKGLYPAGTAMVPAPGPPPDEATVRGRLVSFLEGSSSKAATLRLFDRADVKASLSNPTLRAALASQRGTVAEPVIDYFLSHSRDYAGQPRFDPIPDQSVIANATGGGSSRLILFNPRYEAEHFALLTGVFPHEVLHHDTGEPPGPEEAILNGLSAMVHMQILARHPELATSGTELSRQTNSQAAILANSRAPGSAHIAIVAPNGRGVAPGSPFSKPDFFTLFASRTPDQASPAPPVLATVLRKLLAPGVALPKPLTYSKKTAELFSKMNDTWLSPVDRLRVSVLLGLVSMEEITAYAGLSREQAVSMFRLAPILAVMK
jgi:hypothetical protein